LVERPAESMGRLYDALGETRYPHNFDHVEHDEPELDNRLGLPGLHRVNGPVLARKRDTILPPDLFSKFDHSFWDAADESRQRVLVL
jgi:sulfotransferase